LYNSKESESLQKVGDAMATMEQLLFELQRRVILFKPTTVMPDGSSLGFDNDPNTATGSGTPGEVLVYNCPQGSRYQQSDGTQWYKKTAPNTWSNFGGEGPAVYPVLVDPSHTIVQDFGDLAVVGSTIATVYVTLTFNKGLIAPAYGTTGFRSGDPTTFTFFRNTVQTDIPAGGSLEKILTANNVVIILGVNKWEGRVSYTEGPLPLDSNGNPYGVISWPAGTTALLPATIMGVYPSFATTESIATLTQLPLHQMDAPYVAAAMVAETCGYKQTIWVPAAFPLIIGVRQLLPIGVWAWLGGDKDTSLTFFNIAPDTRIVEGNVVDYYKYVYNGVTIGERTLRFWTEEPPIIEDPEDPGNPVTHSEAIGYAVTF
jgi:hypothetical protein